MFGDYGEGALQKILAAVSFALAVWSAYEQLRVFKMRHEIAKGYAAIAQERWDRFNEAYKPLENAMIAEILPQGPVVADYPAALARGQSNINRALVQTRVKLKTTASKYKVCLDPSLTDDFNLSGTIAGDDGVNFEYRSEEYYAQIMDDLRWSYRSNLLNIGRDLLNVSAQYGQAANGMLAGAAQGAEKFSEGLSNFVGYLKDKGETEYVASWMSSPAPGALMAQGSNASGGDVATAANTTGRGD
jgi:hypothetical protein